MNTKM